MTKIQCSVAGDQNYILGQSGVCARNWYIKNTSNGIIIWNGAFDDAYEAIEAAEMDGFEFAA